MSTTRIRKQPQPQSPKDLDFAALTVRAGVGETDLNGEAQ